MSLLDHLSCAAPVETVRELGFLPTPTSGLAEHWRVHLDRAYVEVTPPRGAVAGILARGWFLGGSAPEATVATLRVHGIPFTGPTPYVMPDGSWLDIELVAATPAIPTLTWRTDAAAATWPPPLEAPHPNGAERLRELRIRAHDPDRLRVLLLALGASNDGSDRLELTDGVTVVIEPGGKGPDGLVSATVTGTAGDLVLDFDGSELD